MAQQIIRQVDAVNMAEWKQALLTVVRLVSFLGFIEGMLDLFAYMLGGHHLLGYAQPIWITILCAVVYGSIWQARRKEMIRRR